MVGHDCFSFYRANLNETCTVNCDVDSALDVTSVKFESEVLSDGCGVQFSNLEDETEESSSEQNTFSNKVEQRTVIKLCVDIGKTPTETRKFIMRSVTHYNVSRSLVFKWHKRSSDGRGSLMDDKRERRPSFNTSNVVKNEERDVIDGDRRLTVREVADKCAISKKRYMKF